MLRSFLALSILMLPLAANAEFTNLACSGEGMSVTVTVDGVAPMQTAVTTLTVDGNEIPSLHECKPSAPGNQGNHRMGKSWRCAHDADGVRFEVYPLYPRLTPPNHRAPYVSVIRWDGDQPTTIELKDCQ